VSSWAYFALSASTAPPDLATLPIRNQRALSIEYPLPLPAGLPKQLVRPQQPSLLLQFWPVSPRHGSCWQPEIFLRIFVLLNFFAGFCFADFVLRKFFSGNLIGTCTNRI
jgi:hypothetical protein